jgi:hypothetical protein
MRGSNSLAEIVHYEPRAAGFSDDGITVPGSSDGARLLGINSQVNQLKALTQLMATEVNTRRASAVIYEPFDAGRQSRDVPCALSVTFNVRSNVLHMTTTMRANNALTLLPYDVFFFSLVGEITACRLGVAAGSHHHSAVSMHYYADESPRVREILAKGAPSVLPKLPVITPDSVDTDLHALLAYEKELRESGTLSMTHARELAARAERLVGLFREFALALLLLHVQRAGLPAAVGDQVKSRLSSAALASVTHAGY